VPTKVRILYSAFENFENECLIYSAFLFYSQSSSYKKLKIPFCTIKIPKIILIHPGTEKIKSKIRFIPQRRSIQLAKSFNKPQVDFNNRIIPKKSNNIQGNFASVPKINNNPARKSIAPKALISMFFKSPFYLKKYHKAPVAQPGLEHLRPKERVVGSNPIGRVS
jgi:hypothetical protein